MPAQKKPLPIAFKALAKSAFPVIDVIISPAVFLACLLLKLVRKMGIGRTKISKAIFLALGVYPIIDHYYEPLFQKKNLKRSLQTERDLPGIDMNIAEQLSILESFDYEAELTAIPMEKPVEFGFYYDNPSFVPGDAEYLYSTIRTAKPKKIVEVGSGWSTLVARKAVEDIRAHVPNYACDHVCIEPYEIPWLDKLEIRLVRELVENCPLSLFQSLESGDILFIDSSHVIRPQGDVTFLFLEVLPRLNQGVLVHIHDIFTPYDIHEGFLLENMYLWNEQYLLEAFLSNNKDFKVIGALNYLKKTHGPLMGKKCPGLRQKFEIGEPRSFWIKKI